jgi:phospholipid-binding lipoprotein MlaA
MTVFDRSRPTPTQLQSLLRLVWLLAGALMLSGCAALSGGTARDPLEPFNRSVTRFNDDLDAAFLKPVATAYKEIAPSIVRKGIGNFFGNLGDIWSFVNSVLQLKPQSAVDNFMRINVNTLFGLWGLIDVATEMGIDRHTEDFGQTLGRWGVPAGPYIVLPVLGPSTVRDTLAFGVDLTGDLTRRVEPKSDRYLLYSLQAIELRASLLRAGSVLDEAALDKYTFLRDVFLQRRRAEIFDGNPPEEEPAPEETAK